LKFLHRKKKVPDFRHMDKELLGASIRHHAHMLDKIVITRWSEGRGRIYKEKLEKALGLWHENCFEKSDDIRWAEKTLDEFNEWNRQNKPIFPERKIEKMESVYNVIKSRRSIRCFEDKSVEKEKILRVLESGMWAPSSGNRQTWTFIVKKRLEKERPAKAELSFQKEGWRSGAVLIYVAIDMRPYVPTEKFAGAMDAAAAIQNMLLMAHSLGLGGCWSYLADLVDQNKLRKRLGLSKYYYVYSVILLGYPIGSPNAPGRKPLERTAKFL
jgi:nitroreductase